MITRNLKGFFGLVLLEFALLNLSFLTTFLIRSSTSEAEKIDFVYSFLPLLVMLNIGWALIAIWRVDPKVYLNNSFQGRVRFLLLNAFILVGILYTVDNFFKLDYFHQINMLAPLFLFIFLDAFLFRVWFRFQKQRSEKRLNAKALIVSGDKKSKKMPELTETVAGYGYEVIGLLDHSTRQRKVAPFSVTGEVRDLSQVLQDNPVDEIFISYSSLKKEELKHAIEAADYHGVRVNLVPEKPSFLRKDFKSSSLHGLPVYQLRQSPLDRFKNYLIKKMFDFSFALGVLVCLAPIFVLLTLLIYLEDRGPIFYKPIRKGKAGKIFKCYKFRTMSVCDDPVNGTKSTEINDPRITRVGKFLRKYDLDELPQFYNVLLGDMSVVGPRPHRVFLQDDFRKIINEYMVRHYVKPGITGWAQVNGWRGPTKTIEQKKQRIDHDLWYIERWSLWLDIKIVFLTVFGKKARKNAF